MVSLDIATRTLGLEKNNENSKNNMQMSVSVAGGHHCCVCKNPLEDFGQSRPLTRGDCELYGVNEADLKPDMRVCTSCRCRSVQRRYSQ